MPWIVYETTNIVNGKKYIGVHRQDGDDFDGYLGSGRAMNAAIRKHGRENFERRTLLAFESKVDAYARETEIVTEEWCKRQDNYNMKPGGAGGFPWHDPEFKAMRYDPEFKAKHSAGVKAKWADPEYRAKQSAGVKAKWADPEYRAVRCDPEFRAKQSAGVKAKWADPEYRAKRSAHSSARMKARHARRRCEKASRLLCVLSP